MSNMKTYKIGRSAKKSDIVLANMSTQVSGVHLELTDVGNNRYYINDLSRNGTFILAANNQWSRIKQTYVDINTQLRLADYQTTVYAIIKAIQSTAEPARNLQKEISQSSKNEGVYIGKVERNPETGEVIRR